MAAIGRQWTSVAIRQLKKGYLGQVLTILANVGVIASIIFLGMEVRDNARQARVSAVQNMAGLLTEWRYRITDDQSLAAIYIAGLEDYNALEPLDQVRFDELMRALLGVVSTAIEARDAGLVPLTPELDRRSLEGRLFRHLDHSGFRQWWETVDRRDIPPRIREVVDELRHLLTRENPSN